LLKDISQSKNLKDFWGNSVFKGAPADQPRLLYQRVHLLPDVKDQPLLHLTAHIVTRSEMVHLLLYVFPIIDAEAGHLVLPMLHIHIEQRLVIIMRRGTIQRACRVQSSFREVVVWLLLLVNYLVHVLGDLVKAQALLELLLLFDHAGLEFDFFLGRLVMVEDVVFLHLLVVFVAWILQLGLEGALLDRAFFSTLLQLVDLHFFKLIEVVESVEGSHAHDFLLLLLREIGLHLLQAGLPYLFLIHPLSTHREARRKQALVCHSIAGELLLRPESVCPLLEDEFVLVPGFLKLADILVERWLISHQLQELKDAFQTKVGFSPGFPVTGDTVTLLHLALLHDAEVVFNEFFHELFFLLRVFELDQL